MIPSELLSMQEILTNSIYKYDISNEFSKWIRYMYYPIVSWAEVSDSEGKLSQNFTSYSYGKWWIFTKLVLSPVSIKVPPWVAWKTYVLSSQNPTSNTDYAQGSWIMIDIQQAGKYVSKLFIFIFIFIHFM